jgi:phosphatidylserine/phosphatidylglycerophosphate/cardiolipin synthase-like enzyme
VQRLSGRGCDVKILLSPTGGMTTISVETAKLLYDAGIPVRCSAVPLHTKMVLIGSTVNNHGRVLFGTANMSTSGLRYSDEHVITIDTRRTSPEFEDDARRLYGEFASGWYEMNTGSTACPTS